MTNRVKYDVPVVPLPERYIKAPTVAELVKSASEHGKVGKPPLALSGALAEWWTLLASDELDGLVNRALNSNGDLRIATLRIAQSHARLEQASADEVPVITLPSEAKTYKPEGGVGTVRQFERVRGRNTYQTSLQGSWRADIWGERAAMYESAEFQFQRAVFQRDDVQRTLIVNIVNNYTELLSLNDRLRVSSESESVLTDMLASVEMRLEKGDATVIELDQQKAAVHAVRATVPVLEQQRVVVLNKLASLLGTVPGELNLSDKGLDSLKFPTVMPGIPSALLLRRPDVKVTEARLLAANADINIARARLLPPLDLTAEVGYGSFFLDKLIRPYSFIGNLAVNLAATVFDHGKRKNEVVFSEAVREEMVETYVKVIYDAVREVDDSLSAIRLMGRRLNSQQLAVDASRRAWHSSIESYKALGVDYLVVLDTERSYQRNLDELYKAGLDKYKGLVSLFGALGGGVPMAGELPGEGERPAPLPTEADYGMVIRSATHTQLQTASSSELPASAPVVDKAAPEQKAAPESLPAAQAVPEKERPVPEKEKGAGLEWSGDEFWMVEVAGLHERTKLAAVWQDLRTRFAKQMENQTMLPRRQDGAPTAAGETTPRYRLFIARFQTAQTAEDLCVSLRDSQFKCRTVSSRLLTHRGDASSISQVGQSGTPEGNK